MIYLVGSEGSRDLVPFTEPLRHGSRVPEPDRGPSARYEAAHFPSRYWLSCHGVVVYDVTTIDHTERVRAEFNDLVRWGVIPDGAVVDLWKLAERLREDRGWAISPRPEDAVPEFPPDGFRLEPYKE